MPALNDRQIKEYQVIAQGLRRDVLNLVYKAKAPHIGSSFSTIEILVALYDRCLNVSPGNAEDINRDIFILSKGHACPDLYCVLARKGFISQSILDGFGINGGTLEFHPTRNNKMGIEVSAGSLGHGLSIGAGMALAAKHDKTKRRVFVLLGDGELNEGSVWEAAMFSAHHNLDNLVAIIDYNKIQATGRTQDVLNLEPLAAKWHSFGWEAAELDGHDFEQLISSLQIVPFQKGKPGVVVAHTVKGKGVSFMENELLWHYRCPDQAEYARALKELS
jgi:transketolase